MKTPAQLAERLARLWENTGIREARLLGDAEWPLRVSIGRPPAETVAKDWSALAGHIRAWRAVTTGRVVWEAANYRATGAPVEIPVHWELSTPREWVRAASSRAVAQEFSTVESLLASTDPLFHSLFVRQRSAWKDKALAEVRKAAQLAMRLEPGCAGGAPLRAVPFPGIDSKFFERHESLILRLLDLRFDGEASRQGLETFLGAWRELDHWLLVADLDGHLLPFPQMRVRGSDLLSADLPAQHLLIVENDRCLHLLPRPSPGTLAILGAGNNLQWLAAPWVRRSRVAYWGDLDTWGLALLASARSRAPHLSALLMDRETFDEHTEAHAVAEPVSAGPVPPSALTEDESGLYQHLLSCERGRVEQEFLAPGKVAASLKAWLEIPPLPPAP